MQTPREFCLKLLIKQESDSSFSNILLDRALQTSKFDDRDKRFVSALFYGVIERSFTLDKIIEKYSKNPLNKLSCDARQILRMGLYQIKYMDSIPDNAAVNESVILAKKNKNPAIPGFVNAVLRNFIRDGMKLPEYKDNASNIAIEYSSPEWLVRKLIRELGEERAVSFLASSLGRAPVTIRINNTRFSEQAVVEALNDEGVNCELSKSVKYCAEISSSGGIEKLESYKNGMFHVQDISCQLCCEALDVNENDVVLDLCAAPGGKTFTIAENLGGKGSVHSFDLHEKRVGLIKQGAYRLGLDNVHASVNNARAVNENMPSADKILCDVPCSGLGVIRRKPEIKYKNPADFEKLPEVQYDILEKSSNYLKNGGILVYSTCTVSVDENQKVVEKFLNNHPEFEGVPVLENRGYKDHMALILPEDFNSDGFFIAKLRKK